MKRITRFETVPLREVPNVIVLREPGAVEKVAAKIEPYAVHIERRKSPAGLNNAFRRPRDGRR